MHALVAEYSFLCDTREYSSVVDLFAEDAEFDESAIGMPVVRGKQGIAEYFAAFGDENGPVDWFMHFNGNQRFTSFTGDTARGTSHLHGEGMLRNRGAARVMGYMEDEYVKLGGRWLFKKRVLVNIAPLQGF